MHKVMEVVHEAISREPHVQNCQIVVSYENGSLVIEGDVGTYYQKQCAQEAVRHAIDGGKLPYLRLTVRNELRVS